MTSAAEERARELSQFFTNGELASQIASWAAVTPRMRVLEPSCGDGALLQAIAGITPLAIGFEIDRKIAEHTDIRTPHGESIPIFWCDFMEVEPEDHFPFHLVVMNPPYEHGADLEHVLHALQFAPRVVALLRLNFLAGMKRHRQLWQNHTLNRLAVFGRRPEFRSPFGHGAKSDYAVFEIVRGRLPFSQPVSVEWW